MENDQESGVDPQTQRTVYMSQETTGSVALLTWGILTIGWALLVLVL